MLTSLTIRDFVIIKSLELNFESGLSALTGETGAGKSILLDALGIVLGRRGEAGLIRKGAESACVIAEMVLPKTHVIFELLDAQSIPYLSHDDVNVCLVIRRLISPQGRSRAYVNDQLVSIGFLREIADYLVEIHGQFDRLMEVSTHRHLLDAYSCQSDLLSIVKTLYHDWKEAGAAAVVAEERIDHLRRHEDFLKYQLKELSTLNLKDGEEEELLKQREGLSVFAKLFDAVSQAYGVLDQSQIVTVLQHAHRSLQKIPEQTSAPIDLAVAALAKGLSEVTEAVAQLEELHAHMEDQPQQLQRIDDRLHQLRGIARKHNTTIGELPAFYQQLRQDLDDLEQAEQRVLQLKREEEKKRDAYYLEGKKLHDIRCERAKALDQAVMIELPDLKLPNARFVTEVTELKQENWHEAGLDRVNFLVAMNRGQNLCPLEKAASGGELARLMLSLKAILATVSCVDTIVFDEIDIGVGGAVAAAIGHRLAKLAKHVQVLVITHSPQVAATADHHFQVSKQDQGEEVFTNVIMLPLDHRHEEIARLLSGEEITNEARAAARSLLARYG